MHNEFRSAIQSKGDGKGSPPKNPSAITTNSKRPMGGHPHPFRVGRPDELEEPRSHKQCKTERAIMERIDAFMQENPPEKVADPRPNSAKWEYNKTLLKTPTPDFFDGLFTYLMGKLEGSHRKYDAQSGKIFRTVRGMGYPELPQAIQRGITQAEAWPEGLRILDWLLDLIDETETLRNPIMPLAELPPQSFEGTLSAQLLYAMDQSPAEVVEAVQQRIMGDLDGLGRTANDLQAELAALNAENERLSAQRLDNSHELQLLERTTEEDNRLENVRQCLQTDVERERTTSVELNKQVETLRARTEAIKRELVKTTEALVLQDMSHTDLENFKRDIAVATKSIQTLEEQTQSLEAELSLGDQKLRDLAEKGRMHIDGILRSGVLAALNIPKVPEEVLTFEHPNVDALRQLDELEIVLDREAKRLHEQTAELHNRKLAAEVVARNLELEKADLEKRIADLEAAISREKEEVSALLDKEGGLIRNLSAMGSDLEERKRTIAAELETAGRELTEKEQERAKAQSSLENLLDDLATAKRAFEAAKRELFESVMSAKERLIAILRLRVQLDTDVVQKTRQFCQEFLAEALDNRPKDS